MSSVVVVEVFEHALELKLLIATKEPKVYRLARRLFLEGNFTQPGDVLSAFRRLKIDRFSAHPFLLILHSKLISTIRSSAVVLRSDPTSVITDAEIENLIATALWKLLNKERHDSAQKLSLAETDVVFGAAAIVGVKLDKHRVQNPIGFKAHAVEFECEYHCLSRSFLKDIERLIGEDRLVSMVELGASEAALLGESRALFAEVGKRETTVFSVERGEVRYTDTIAWGTDRISAILQETFALSPLLAKQLLTLREMHAASDSFLRKLENVIIGEVSLLWKGIASELKDVCAASWGYCLLHPLPSRTEEVSILKRANLESPVLKVDASTIGNRTGFHLQLNGSRPGAGAATFPSEVVALAALAHAHTFLPPSPLTKIAMRRARWLQPNK